MGPRSIRVIAAKPQPHVRVRVAAYARVSTGHERQLSSMAHQVSHYLHLIQSTPGWEYAGVFIDEGITGTSETRRDGFHKMMAAARAGKIDMIITKSISRLARNTVDLLQTVRELRARNVAVRFERENIDTSTADGELLLTLLASFAQEESHSNSTNVKWAIRNKYANGDMHSRQPYGYRYINGELVVVDTEAVVVKRVFNEFLAGISPEASAARLNAEGIKPRRGRKFHGQVLRSILENEVYTGRAILQKYYRPQVGNTAVCTNTGQLPRYLVAHSHPAIISEETFQAVAEELAKRRRLGRAVTPTGGSCGLTSKITCSVCGRHYQRRTKTRRHISYKFWWCETATKGQGNPCRAPQIRETFLTKTCTQLLGIKVWDDRIGAEQIENITATPEGELTIHTTSSNTPTVVSIYERNQR